MLRIKGSLWTVAWATCSFRVTGMPGSRSYSSVIVIGILLFLVIVAGIFFVWQSFGRKASEPAPKEVKEEPVVPTTSTYASSTLGFSVSYPSSYIVNDAYRYEAFKNKPISGIKFSVPPTMATGTNLALDSGVSIEWLPRAQKCTGDIYVLANVKAVPLIEASTTYSVATSSEGAAGNVYEEMVYAISPSSPCTAVRYFIHSTSVANYPLGTIRAFDREALLRDFDSIRRSLRLQ